MINDQVLNSQYDILTKNQPVLSVSVPSLDWIINNSICRGYWRIFHFVLRLTILKRDLHIGANSRSSYIYIFQLENQSI